MLVTTHAEGNKDTFLFDTGVTIDGVLHNLDVLQVKPNEMRAIVLSHGHTDHTRGLIGLIKRYGRPRIPIVLHPDAFLKRKNIFPDGHETEHIPPSQRDLEAEGVEIIEEREPTMLVGGHALVTGQIARTTSSKRQPGASGMDRRQVAADPWIRHQAASRTKDKGLRSSCRLRPRRGR
jgi:7,8-dihydropterin-6-yl-methyl-4-(beta-D-ribofuranosyl)aminobenzene 5'-phosphate synthase